MSYRASLYSNAALPYCDCLGDHHLDFSWGGFHHKSLPPSVQSGSISFSISFWENGSGDVVLTEQYRCISSIAEVASKAPCSPPGLGT